MGSYQEALNAWGRKLAMETEYAQRHFGVRAAGDVLHQPLGQVEADVVDGTVYSSWTADSSTVEVVVKCSCSERVHWTFHDLGEVIRGITGMNA